MFQQPACGSDHRNNKRKRKRKNKHNSNDRNNEKPPTFDDIEEMDATEYLRRVAQEAKTLPEVFQAVATTTATTTVLDSNTVVQSNRRHHHHHHHGNQDDDIIIGSAACAQYLVSPRTALVPPPTPYHVPSREWVDQTIANFDHLREYLDTCRSQGFGGRLTNRTPVPALKDRSGWLTFCVGKEEAYGNPGGYFQDDYDDDDDDDDNKNNNNNKNNENQGNEEKNQSSGEEDDDDDETTTITWEANLPENGYTPNSSLLLQMDQIMVRRVLHHLVYYVGSGWSAATPHMSAWIYALLSRLERPIHREDAVNLYSLLKKLTLERSEIKFASQDNPGDTTPNDSSTADTANANDIMELDEPQRATATLNVLIAIISVYFEQGGRYSTVMEVSKSNELL